MGAQGPHVYDRTEAHSNVSAESGGVIGNHQYFDDLGARSRSTDRRKWRVGPLNSVRISVCGGLAPA